MLDLTSRYYPREVFHINENITRENMRKYDENIEKWYDIAEKYYADFYKLKGKEKEIAVARINEIAGFCRGDF